MTLPALRIGDQSGHGGVVTVGTPTTLIGGKFAARMGDMHTCALVTVLVPHVGGPIILGAFNVLVGLRPQARSTDLIICVGPPDLGAIGHTQTLVGMAGAFGGGLGGLLGLAVGGALAADGEAGGAGPKAVVDSGGGACTQYSKGVKICGSPEFQAKVRKDLDKLASTKAGQKVLDDIARSGKTVTIRESKGNNSTTYDNDGRFTGPYGEKGGGSNSTVTYNPAAGKSGTGTEKWMDRPPDVGLFHEIKHGADAAGGKQERGSTMIDGRVTDKREAQAVGLGDWSKDPDTENAYRKERGQPARPRY